MERKFLKQNLTHLWDATRFSLKGLAAAWRHETAFRQEIVIIVPLLPVAFWLGTTAAQRAVLILSAMLIFIVELLNSAVESVVDRIGPEKHPLSGRAKDLGSAAVLISLIAAGLVWIIVAWERFTV